MIEADSLGDGEEEIPLDDLELRWAYGVNDRARQVDDAIPAP